MPPVYLKGIVRATAFLPLLVFCCSAAHLAGRHTLSGVILDRTGGDPIAAANVRVAGTSRGTIANDRGEYALLLEPGRYTLIFSSLGYHPDTITIDFSSAATRNESLMPADITLPEIVVTAEDPAIEIIRRAIASKHHWIDRLASYILEAFTRQTILRDTAIASITESFTTGYWRQGDTLREVMSRKRQTENIPSQFNFASVGRITNFNDDEIRFAGFTFVGPTALHALDYYDYKLVRTYTIQGRKAFEIRMIPRTRTVPLFRGTITIAADTYALAGIDFEPNDAFQLPFVTDRTLRYRQQFGLYDSLFWMPADIRIDASVRVGILGLKIPPIGFHQTSVITNYRINAPIPDSVFSRPRLVVDSSASRSDSAFWTSNVVLPLNPAEREAYRILDSTKTLDVQFRPGGMAMTLGLGDSTSSVMAVLSDIDFTFNRVEGLHLGALHDFDSVSSHAEFTLGTAYGVSRHHWTYRGGATIYPLETRQTLGIGGQVYDVVGNAPDQGYYDAGTIGVSALLGKNDYRDYFSARGWTMFVTTSPFSSSSFRFGYTAEKHETVTKQTDFSLIYASRPYRENPTIQEGTLRSVTAWARIGPEPVPLDLVSQNSLELNAEHASRSILGGDFNFTRFNGIITLTVPTFSTRYLFPPALRIRMTGGSSFGSLPPQRIFAVETQLAGYGPFGVMRAGQSRELTGTSAFSATVEHNFRSLPFLALGIPFLYTNSIELITYGGFARVWGSPSGSSPSTRYWYTEAGIGISRIFDFLRMDLTWRLSVPRNLYFTIGAAQIL